MIFVIKRNDLGLCRRILLLMSLVSFILLSSYSHASTSSNITTLEFLDNGRLTLNVQGVPLGTLLKQIQQKTKLEYEVHEKHLEQLISVKFQSLPLEEAIKRILRGINYACVFDSQGKFERIIALSDTSRAKGSSFPRSSQGSDTPYGMAVEPHPEEIISTKDTVDEEPKSSPEFLNTPEDSMEVNPPPEVLEALEDAMGVEPPPEVFEATEDAVEVRPQPDEVSEALKNAMDADLTPSPRVMETESVDRPTGL